MSHLEKLDLYQNTINELRPFEGEILKQIKEFYRIGLTWTSNALEGNSLTMSETKVLIEDGLAVGGPPLRDIFEAVDHAKAYDYMFTLLDNKEIAEKELESQRAFLRLLQIPLPKLVQDNNGMRME